MKVRKGFVSNSSSSSFVCGVCDEIVSGWDMGLSEAEMVECNGCHETYCQSHQKELSDEQKREEFIKYMRNYYKLNISEHQRKIDEAKAKNEEPNPYWAGSIKEYENHQNNIEEFLKTEEAGELCGVEDYMDENFEELEYYYPEAFCPICTLEEIPSSDSVVYLMKKLGLNEADIEKEIREKFKNRKELMEYCKGE